MRSKPKSQNQEPRPLTHKYNVGTAFERIARNMLGPFPESERGNRYLLISMAYFTTWLGVYAIPN